MMILPRITKFACFHLCLAVILIMQFFSGGDKIEHVRSDQETTQLSKVAVVVVFHLGTAPAILTTLHAPAIGCDNILGGANDSKWQSCHDVGVAFGGCLVFTFDWAGINLNVLGSNDSTDLRKRGLKRGCLGRDKA